MKLLKIINSGACTPAARAQRWRQITDTTLCSSPSISKPNFRRLSNADLFNLFELIDGQFFNAAAREHITRHNHRLDFRVSKRMTSSGGITTTRLPLRRNGNMKFEIAISSTLLFESFRDDKPISVTGMLCENRLQALMRIMEHEMIHLIEMMLWHDSSCRKKRFRDIAFRFFGHRQSTHQLLAPADTAEAKFDISVGDYVTFKRGASRLGGFVNRITKRATILVPHRQGTLYSDGKRYEKYYVPIAKLTKKAG